MRHTGLPGLAVLSAKYRPATNSPGHPPLHDRTMDGMFFDCRADSSHLGLTTETLRDSSIRSYLVQSARERELLLSKWRAGQ
jgi:hypothetical protein